MIWFLIIIILAIVYAIWAWFEDSFLWEIIFGVVGFLFVGFFFAVLLNWTFSNGDGDYKLVESTPMHALADGTNMEGGGLIFVHIDEEDNYVYMVENEDGTFQKERTSTYDVRILESNDIQPSIQVYEDSPANKWISIEGESYTQFVVPEGTVINSYNIDLE